MLKPETLSVEIKNNVEKAANENFDDNPSILLQEGEYGQFTKEDINKNFNQPLPPKMPPIDFNWEPHPGWEEEVINFLAKAIKNSRSLKLSLELCQKCGICADKCHYYMGSSDKYNMPVMRAELIRTVWKKYLTTSGRLLPSLNGAQKLDPQMLKKWWKYFFQCSLCRRCAVFCPFGIDTSEFTSLGREIIWRLGLSPDWVSKPAWNSHVTGNHMGMKQETIIENINFLISEIKEYVGIDIEPRINRKNAEALFIFPSADIHAEPGIFTFMGYLLLFEQLGLDYTISTFAAEAGNFGSYLSPQVAKMLVGKFYQEAERLNSKWLIAGECGIMTRIMNQYLNTMWEAPPHLEIPRNPLTGTIFKSAASTKMVHVLELAADAIVHNKLKLNPKRNDHLTFTYHDSCNTARGFGLLEEPRIILKAAANNFFEMPSETIREKTLCCGGGGGLNGAEYLKTRMMGGYPRAMEVGKLVKSHQVNALACNCAVDRATLPPLMNFWGLDVTVYGLSEVLGNALIMPGENNRPTDLRGEEIKLIS